MSRSCKYCSILALSTFLSLCLLISAFLYYRSERSQGSIKTWHEILPFFSSVQNPTACGMFHEFGGVLNRQPSMVFLDGQKAVCLDDGVRPNPESCLVYSFGNNAEWSFDEQIESYGCKVYTFDPSVRLVELERTLQTLRTRITDVLLTLL